MVKWCKSSTLRSVLFAAIPIFILFAIIVNEMYIKNQPSADFYHTMLIDESITQLQNRFDNFESRLFPEDQFLSDMSCEYGQFQPETNTIPLTLSFQPNTAFAQFKEAILHCNGANIPLTLDNGRFITSYETKIFIPQNISAITFLDGEVLKTELFTWRIDPSSQVIPQILSVADLNTNGKSGNALSYSGMLHVSVVHLPEKSKGIKEVTLIKRLDNQEESRNPIKHQIQNYFQESFTINKKVQGKIPEGSTLELIIELVDQDSLCYQYTLQHLDSDGKGLWDRINDVRVYDKDGVCLYKIHP